MRNFDAYGYGTDLFRSDLPAHFFSRRRHGASKSARVRDELKVGRGHMKNSTNR